MTGTNLPWKRGYVNGWNKAQVQRDGGTRVCKEQNMEKDVTITMIQDMFQKIIKKRTLKISELSITTPWQPKSKWA